MSLQMRAPWIGSRFEGLLILGESHYGEPEDLELTKTVVQGVVDRSAPHAFFTKVEIAVTGESSSRSGSDSFWQTVAFANFCPGAVDGPRQRPSFEMWTEGYRLFPKLMSFVKPKRVLVLGYQLWDNIGGLTEVKIISASKKDREAGRLDAEAGPNGQGVPITSIRHPTAFGFSAREWHAFYLSFLKYFPDN